MTRTPRTSAHCILMLAAALATAACAGPEEFEAPIGAEARALAPPSALAFGLNLMNHFNGIVGFGAIFGLDVSALITGSGDTVTLSQASLDAIAHVVDDALARQYLLEGEANLQTLMTLQSLYIRRDCTSDRSCTDRELDAMDDDIRLVEEHAVGLYDELKVLGDRRLQVGAPLMTAGASRLFALHETALIEAQQGNGRTVNTIEGQIRSTARAILADLDGLERLYAREVAARFSADVFHTGRSTWCWNTPRGRSCLARGEGLARSQLARSKVTYRAWTFGPADQYAQFRERLVDLRDGRIVELPGAPEEPACDPRISAGTRLSLGDRLTACNGRYALVSGNNVGIVRIDEDRQGRTTETVTWQTHTAGRNYGLEVTRDGQLVIGSRRGRVWTAGVRAGSNAYARLEDDGALVLYRSNDTAVWSSAAAGAADTVDFGGRIALLGAHRRYLVAERDYEVNANRTRVGPWERFTVRTSNGGNGGGAVEFGDTISLYTAHGRYLVAERDGRLRGDRSRAGSWERFTVVDPGNTGRRSGAVPCGATIALRSAHNRYVVAESDGRARANRAHIGPWEQMQVLCQ